MATASKIEMPTSQRCSPVSVAIFKFVLRNEMPEVHDLTSLENLGAREGFDILLTRGSATSEIRRGELHATSRPASISAIRVAEQQGFAQVVGHEDDRFSQPLLQGRNSRCNSARVMGSSAPKGSSISRIDGSAARARATPTRCRCPPESSRG